jgi:hypothetical protein
VKKVLRLISLLTLAVLGVAIVGQALIVALGLTYTPTGQLTPRRRSPWE